MWSSIYEKISSGTKVMTKMRRNSKTNNYPVFEFNIENTNKCMAEPDK